MRQPQEGGRAVPAGAGHAQGQGGGAHSPAHLRRAGEKEGTGEQGGQGPARQDGQARKPGAGSGLGTRTGKSSLPGPEGMGCGWEHGGTPGAHVPVSGVLAPVQQWATWDGC